jgi:hypothetical protein
MLALLVFTKQKPPAACHRAPGADVGVERVMSGVDARSVG